MTNTTAVYARIDSHLKNSAENILAKLGISPSAAIQMLYSQVVLTGGLPFQPVLPVRKPKILEEMTKAELDEELAKGMRSVENGDVYTMEEMNQILAKEFGI